MAWTQTGLLLLLSALAVAGEWTQNLCTDSGCSENCIAKAFEEGGCYPTEASGTSARVWCEDEGSVLKSQIFSESTDCSGFSYINMISAGVCNEGLNGYFFVDNCIASIPRTNLTAMSRFKVNFVIRPAPAALGNLSKEQKRLIERKKVLVDFTQREERIFIRHFPLPPQLETKDGKPLRLKVRQARVKLMASNRRSERLEKARVERGYYAGFGPAKLVSNIVAIGPRGRTITIHKKNLIAFLKAEGWTHRRAAEVVFLDNKRREVFMVWIKNL